MPENPVTVLASSVGVTRAINLDWRTGGPTTVRVTTPSTVTPSAAGVLKYSLDDPMVSTSTVLWTPVSSVANSTIAGTILLASNLVDVAYTYIFQHPVAALRFDSSAFSSAGFRIDVLQGRSY